ncbi:MAG: glycosyltransferase [Leptospiraceae bacterium]|nr:glycosyltransferase [Leptospiraceae bacterium]MDW7976153.1 glycosyltransferase [Leptospiraceae bacterium]
MKVAIVHDWLTGMRGGEVVLEALLDLFPEADLFTLLHIPNCCSDKIEKRKIYTSFIQNFPFKEKLYRYYLPFFPTAIEEFDFWGYDLVFSSSHCVAKGVIVPPDVPHISYIHTPMRYVWDMYRTYFPGENFLQKFLIPFFANYLRTWDSASAHRVDQYIANSQFVARRIKKYYGRDAVVIHPPCIKNFPELNLHQRDSFYLIVSALVPYKRVDIAVRAFRKLNQKLIIAGNGPELNKLKKLATPNIEFWVSPSKTEIAQLYQRAKALIFPGIEDFGIVPVEAQSYGCPVIAYRRGGALETVVENETGIFFDEQNENSLIDAIKKFENFQFNEKTFRNHLMKFTYDNFIEKIKKIVFSFTNTNYTFS